MDEFVRDVYLFEAVTQCKFALNAQRGLDNVLPRLPQAAKSGDFKLRQTLHDEVFRSIHSFLTHVSNVSRLFWPALPTQGKNEDRTTYDARCSARANIARAVELRSAIGVGEQHALTSRKLRDHLDHFDERLDNWASGSERRNFVQDLIGGTNSISGIDAEDMMRWYDPSTRCMRFRGEVFDLQAISDGVVDVMECCIATLESGRFKGHFRDLGT
jgi:hypothetical protein